MKTGVYLLIAAVAALFLYLWNQIRLWRCAMTGSQEVSAGGVVSESLVCAAKLGLYGLSYDSSTGGVGIGTLPDGDVQSEIEDYRDYWAVRTDQGQSTGEQSTWDAVKDFILPWEEYGMTMDEWCQTDLPTNTQRFAYCGLITWL